jgi:hypothetical protein
MIWLDEYPRTADAEGLTLALEVLEQGQARLNGQLHVEENRTWGEFFGKRKPLGGSGCNQCLKVLLACQVAQDLSKCFVVFDDENRASEWQ